MEKNRKQRERELRKVLIAVLNVPCPDCNAIAGKPCTYAGEVFAFRHTRRWMVAFDKKRTEHYVGHLNGFKTFNRKEIST